MTDIDEIRRKHEAQVAYTKEKQGNFPYLFQSIQSNLRISDVDALFAALDEARGKTKKPKVCRLCGKTLKKSHKYINVGNGEVEHRSCISPISYPFMGPLRKETDHEA